MMFSATRAMLALAVLGVALIAQAPDPAAKNVEEIKIEKTNTERLDVHKSHSVKVISIWKFVDGFWVQVWRLGQTGGYELDGQSTGKSKLRKADGSKFTKDDKYRIVIDPSGSDGDTTEIEKVTEHSQ